MPGMQCSSAAPPAPDVRTLVSNERPSTPALCTLCFHEKGLEGFPQLNKNKGVGKGEVCLRPRPESWGLLPQSSLPLTHGWGLVKAAEGPVWMP